MKALDVSQHMHFAPWSVPFMVFIFFPKLDEFEKIRYISKFNSKSEIFCGENAEVSRGSHNKYTDLMHF